jgi:hypothetical protein
MEPTERSNSPPIIKSAAPMARMPSWAAGDMKVRMPESVNIRSLATIQKKSATSRTPASAPSSGRRISRVRKEVCFSRSSAVTTAMPVSLGAARRSGRSRGQDARGRASHCPAP